MIDLEAIRARGIEDLQTVRVRHGTVLAPDDLEADESAIDHAITDIPDLLAEVDRLQEAVNVVLAKHDAGEHYLDSDSADTLRAALNPKD